MSKIKRNERIGAIVKVLCSSPNEIYTLSHFTELFNAAKSTISEDLTVVKKIMEDHHGTLTLDDRPGGGARIVLHFMDRLKTTNAKDDQGTEKKITIHGA